jgi:hypothetical protein
MPHSFHRCQFEHGELKSVAKKKKLFYELHRHANLQRGTQRRSTQTSISSPISLSPTLRPPQPKQGQSLTPCKIFPDNVAY